MKVIPSKTYCGSVSVVTGEEAIKLRDALRGGTPLLAPEIARRSGLSETTIKQRLGLGKQRIKIEPIGLTTLHRICRAKGLNTAEVLRDLVGGAPTELLRKVDESVRRSDAERHARTVAKAHARTVEDYEPQAEPEPTPEPEDVLPERLSDLIRLVSDEILHAENVRRGWIVYRQ